MPTTETITNSIIEFFYHWEKETPNKIFLRQPKGDRWHTLTFAKAGQIARKIATALRDRGLKPGDHVGILSKNCQHWVLADLAIMMGGFVSIPYYASLPKEQLEQVLGLSDLKALFVGKLEQWGDKSEAISDNISVIKFPHYEGSAKVDIGEDWDELLRHSEPASDNYVPKADDLWTIKFTSGTTGTPKGVMHVHATPVEIIQNEKKTNWLGIDKIDDIRLLSFLPMNHVVERVGVEIIGLALGGTISFVESLNTFPSNLKDAFKTSKGSYITPNPKEEILMKNDFIEQVCVAGLGIPQPIALINLSEVGLGVDKETLQNSILKSIEEVNNRGAKFERISTAVIDEAIWSEANEFLTPTLKVKRWKLDEQYGKEYMTWYESADKVIWK